MTKVSKKIESRAKVLQSSFLVYRNLISIPKPLALHGHPPDETPQFVLVLRPIIRVDDFLALRDVFQ
jgi:hypothetical protein